MSDIDEPEDDVVRSDGEPDKPTRNEAGEWVCPECGETYKLAIQLGAHRRSKHGVAGSSKSAAKEKRRRERGGSSGAAPRRQDSRKTRIKQALLDLANLSDDLRGRSTGDLPEHLAEVIRRDADALATMLAALAERVNPIRFFVDRVLVLAAPVTASSGVLRWLLRAWRRQLEERETGEEPELTLVEPDMAAWRGAEPVYGPEDAAELVD